VLDGSRPIDRQEGRSRANAPANLHKPIADDAQAMRTCDGNLQVRLAAVQWANSWK
jgi:hypothetical protein